MRVARWILATILFAAVPTAIVSWLSWDSLPQTPHIKSQQQSNGRLQSQQDNTQQTERPQNTSAGNQEIVASSGQGKGQSNTDERSEQGTEFWPSFYGYRLKVTDTLLVVVTFLLFGATFALWLSTRRLVRGAEVTAQQQLRAYIGVRAAKIMSYDGGNTFTVEIETINSGQTPGHKVRYGITAEQMGHPSILLCQKTRPDNG
jgi:hypothetical protein